MPGGGPEVGNRLASCNACDVEVSGAYLDPEEPCQAHRQHLEREHRSEEARKGALEEDVISINTSASIHVSQEQQDATQQHWRSYLRKDCKP